MVDEPLCAQKGPYQVTLEAGKAYFWCACGRSAKQPFCDGSHKATSFQPHRFVAEFLGDLQPVRLQGNGRPAVLRRHPQHSLIAVARRLAPTPALVAVAVQGAVEFGGDGGVVPPLRLVRTIRRIALPTMEPAALCLARGGAARQPARHAGRCGKMANGGKASMACGVLTQ